MALFSLQWLTINILVPVVLGLGTIILLKRTKSRRLPYPPGPPAKDWLTGNLSEVPLDHTWIKFTQWARTYGDIVYFRLLHRPNLIINELDTAIELLEKRSNIYSGRLRPPIAKLMGWDWITTLMAYDDDWRAQRRYFQQHFSTAASRKYEHIQTTKIQDFLLRLLVTPEDFFKHIRHTSGAVIMSVTYDYNVAPQDDHFIEIAERAINGLVRGAAPGAFLVNSLPFLRRVPEWFPGASWKTFCRETSVAAQGMLQEPVHMVQERMRTGDIGSCVAADLLEHCGSNQELKNIMATCATAYAGGADTSVAVIEAFFYAMVNFDDVQIKAQEEISRTIGNDRLPTLEDRSSLPYVEAVCREVLRWRPILPLCVMHCTTDEDTYDGYYIPKGTLVFPIIWAMTRDPRRYKDSEDFNPSRFLNEDSQLNDDDVGYVFGFGRRVCPGRHFGYTTVWLTIALVLATFNIRKQKDAHGDEIPVSSGFNGEIVTHPFPFKCSITPRSETAQRLVQDVIALRD